MTQTWGDLATALRMSPLTWSVLVVDASTGDALLDVGSHRQLKTASGAKILVLLEAARQLEAGSLSAAELLPRDPALAAADSGIWQHLSVPELPVEDVARLVGMVSDNWATNVLLHRVGGPQQVADTARRARLHEVNLHDRVRDERGPGHPPTLSTGSAAGYADLLVRLHRGTLLSPAVSARVREWLRDGVDLSMVAAAFGLDPLAHTHPDRRITVVHKTGTDAGVRVDVGIATGPSRSLAYACLANWTSEQDLDPWRDEALAAMRAIGDAVRAEIDWAT
ncbi:MAG: hypothetical protein ABS63_11995 [Microbacterium sp. SCN 70-27]|uniref:serine hydrolase n=1 Tax=unclassified Microbacterium TaxID=2609290 RepID=UPI00086A9F63|nr:MULTISPECIES: serine hydrolase [unclassified Microbacterium]MBN9224084.1 serine hydrolase [Microbacterium sp.]ODT26298.1 MAG: hypothetical protein ABS63_11995 [Microbacterium sp. SCN 70-27]